MHTIHKSEKEVIQTKKTNHLTKISVINIINTKIAGIRTTYKSTIMIITTTITKSQIIIPN